jgi:murein DD-endopeptidase MepM/ murein hydrolase activator NlpD
MIACNKYVIPVPQSLLQGIDRTPSPAHVGKLRNAVDFIAPQSTPVLAAADGAVRYVKDESSVGGPNPSYWNYTNFIAIMHQNGEYTRYDHLQHNCAKERSGQRVQAGQEIARVGMTGYTHIPHLHFQVFVFTGYNIFTDFDTMGINNFV